MFLQCVWLRFATASPLTYLQLPDMWGTRPGKPRSLGSYASCLIFSQLLPELAVIPEATKQFIDNHAGKMALFSLLNCEFIRPRLEWA